MHTSSFLGLACALVLLALITMRLAYYRTRRRCRLLEADRAELTRHYSELDRELDQVWHSLSR